jgi:hypothetical protein
MASELHTALEIRLLCPLAQRFEQARSVGAQRLSRDANL